MLFLPEHVLGREGEVSSAPPVSLTLSAEHHTFAATQTILLSYVIKNISDHGFYVPRVQWTAVCPARPLIWASFQDKAGKDLPGGYAGSCSPSVLPLGERMAKEAVLLQPASSMEGVLDIDPTALSLGTGEYRIKVVLYGWTDADFPAEQLAQVKRMRPPLLHGDFVASIPITLLK